MQSKLLVSAIAVLGLSACSTIRDDIPENRYDLEQLDHRTVELAPFNKVFIDLNARVDISEGTVQEVIIASEPGHFSHIVTSVEDGVMLIDHKERHMDKYHTYVKITVPNLEALTIDAVTWTELHDVHAQDFEMIFDGIGDVELEGSCVNGRFIVDGIGDMDGSEFKCQHVIADFDGIGSMRLHASETLEITASGIGDVQVDGSPRIKKSKIGGIGSADIGDH